MAKVLDSLARPDNQLLSRLSQSEYQRLLPLFRLVPLRFGHILHEPRASINDVFFPTRGVISAVTVLRDGSFIEVATVGNEGLVGLTALLSDEESPHRQIVQVGGEALRMDAIAFRAEIFRNERFRKLVARYQTAFLHQVSQAVACNGLHLIHQRCCRWLLMTHDRARQDEFPMTHEFLSHMLGVRRVSITEVLKPLQKTGLIRQGRGRITVLDRPGLEKASCECYQCVQDEFARLLG